MHAVQSITLSQVREAMFARTIYTGDDAWQIGMRCKLAAPVIDGVRVVTTTLQDGGDVYDWAMTADELRDGDVFVFDGGVGVLVEAWPVLVYGKARQLHTLVGTTWAALDGGKYAAAASVAGKLVAGIHHSAVAI